MIRAALLILALLTAPAHADSIRVTVAGYDGWCANHPSFCQSEPDSQIYFTPSFRASLQHVQSLVNSRIRYGTDARERWAIFPETGDCEDYAITKLALLLADGYPRSSMRLAFVQFQQLGVWQNHMVLVVHTTAGDYVLDNRRESVLPLSATDYRWFARETARNGRTEFRSVARSWDDFWNGTAWKSWCGYDCMGGK